MKTTRTAPRTLTIKTGGRTWNLRVLKQRLDGTLLVESVRVDNSPGKLYIIRGRELVAVQFTRKLGTRLYTWTITQGLPKRVPVRRAA